MFFACFKTGLLGKNENRGRVGATYNCKKLAKTGIMEAEKPPVSDLKKKRASTETIKAEEPPAKTMKSASDDSLELNVHDDLKALGRKLHAQKTKLISNIGFSSGPSSKLLAVITNDVSLGKKKMEENGHKELFILSAAVLQVLDPGYLNSPYEPAAHTPPKFRIYTNDDGKPKDGHKPVNLARVQKAKMMEDKPPVDILTFQSYNDHPKTALRTKCRGEPTGTAGVIPGGGLPLNFMGYADACRINNLGGGDQRLGVDAIKQFGVVILNVKIKSNEKCTQGFGLSLTGVEVLPDFDVCMPGLYPEFKLYDHVTQIGEQTDAIMSKKLFSQTFDNDFHFIRNYFRQQEKKDTVSEKPIVRVASEVMGKNTQIHVISNNSTLQLVFDDSSSIYHGKTMDIHIPEHCFSQRTRTAGLYWIQQLYRFYLQARIASVVVVHDEYRFRQSDSAKGLVCFVVPDYNALVPSQAKQAVVFAESHVSSLKEKKFGGIDVREKLSDGSLRYSAWEISTDNRTKCIVISDNNGVKFAKKTDTSENDSVRHSSVVCQLYQGMSPARGVFMSYLVVMNDVEVTSVLVCGLKQISTEENADGAALSALVAVPEEIVDVDSVFD